MIWGGPRCCSLRPRDRGRVRSTTPTINRTPPSETSHPHPAPHRRHQPHGPIQLVHGLVVVADAISDGTPRLQEVPGGGCGHSPISADTAALRRGCAVGPVPAGLPRSKSGAGGVAVVTCDDRCECERRITTIADQVALQTGLAVADPARPRRRLHGPAGANPRSTATSRSVRQIAAPSAAPRVAGAEWSTTVGSLRQNGITPPSRRTYRS